MVIYSNLCVYVTGGEIEAQKGEVTCPRKPRRPGGRAVESRIKLRSSDDVNNCLFG